MDVASFILAQRKASHLSLGGLSAAGVDSGSLGLNDWPDFKRKCTSTQDTESKKAIGKITADATVGDNRGGFSGRIWWWWWGVFLTVMNKGELFAVFRPRRI